MVKERSYKILEQLDEFELQEPAESSVAAYHGDVEQSLTRDSHANAVPSAMDSDDDDDNDDEKDDDNDDNRAVADSQSHSARTAIAAAAVPAEGSADAGPTQPPQGSATRSTGPSPTDGVFANLAAKPEL
ncbi:hypothetical protein GGF42_004984, partial [Coemansia sp. RSA 2424]